MPMAEPGRKPPAADLGRKLKKAPDAKARGVHADLYMYVSFDHEQLELVRETLQHALTELRVESARTDSTRYREMLHHREDVLRSALAKISEDAVLT